MATRPTAEEAARRILSIFKEKGSRPGDVLFTSHFLTAFATGQWRASDFKPGAEYAVAQGWIEVVVRDKFKLTDAGFSEI